MKTKPEPKERIRLIADRLCYMEKGFFGLINRHAMQDTMKRNPSLKWSDEYDLRATKIVASESN